MRLWYGSVVREMPRSRQKSVQGASFQQIRSVRLNRFQGRGPSGEAQLGNSPQAPSKSALILKFPVTRRYHHIVRRGGFIESFS